MADPLQSLHWLLVVVSAGGVMVVVAVGDMIKETRARRERKRNRKRSEKREQQMVAKQINRVEITHSLIFDGIMIRACSSLYRTHIRTHITHIVNRLAAYALMIAQYCPTHKMEIEITPRRNATTGVND